MKDLKHNFSYQFLTAITGLVFPLLTFPYITATLGPAMLGKVNYVDFLSNLIISLTCLGIPLYGTREIAKARHDPQLRMHLFRDLLKIQLITALAGVAIFSFFLLNHPRYLNEHWLIGLGILYILSNVFSADWYLQGMEAFKFIFLRSFLLRAAGLVAIFLLLQDPADYAWYYGIIALTQFATVLLNYTYIRPSVNLKGLPSKTAEHLPLLFYFFIASTFISIYDYTDTVMLGWLSTDENVGYYTAAMKLVKIPLVVVLTVNTIFFPRLSYFLSEQRKEDALRLLNKSVNFIVTIAVPAMALFIFLAPEIIAVFAGKAFHRSVNVIQWLSPLPLVISLSNLFLLYYLSRFSKKKGIIALVVLAMLVSLSLNYILIPVLQEKGAAIASVCTETFIMVFFAAWLKIKIELKPVGQAILGSVLFLPIVIGIRQLNGDSIAILLISLATCGLVYAILQLLLKNETMRAVMNYLVNMAGRKKE